MKTFKTIPERGDFAYQCLVGPQKVSGEKLADLRDHFGLKLTKHMPFGSVRDDEEMTAGSDRGGGAAQHVVTGEVDR